MIVAETERLILRKLTPDDAGRLFEIYSDTETMRFMGDGPASVEAERSAIEQHIGRYYEGIGGGFIAVEERSSQTLIGRCGVLLQEIGGRNRRELSYLLDRPYWRQGYATEAASAMISVARTEYRLSELVAMILSENIGSVRVALKCGFRLERTLPEFKIWRNVDIYRLQLDES